MASAKKRHGEVEETGETGRRTASAIRVEETRSWSLFDEAGSAT